MKTPKKYFEVGELKPVFSAVLDNLARTWSHDEKAGILEMDEETAEILKAIPAHMKAENAIRDKYPVNAYTWTRDNLDKVLAYAREQAKEIGYNNEIDNIYSFNWNNANKWDFRHFEPVYTATEIARALFVEDDDLRTELFEVLAEYALEEMASLIECCELTEEEAEEKRNH